MANEQLLLDIQVADQRPDPDVRGRTDVHLAIKRAAALDLKGCRWSRLGVADALSKELGRHITAAQLDAITAETKHDHRFPAAWIPAWVSITGSRRILDLLCRECGLVAADETERGLADLARAELDREKAGKRVADLRSRLRGRI